LFEDAKDFFDEEVQLKLQSAELPVEKEMDTLQDPNPPESIKIRNISSTSVTLTWHPSAYAEKKYHVICVQNGKTVHEEETETNTFVVNNLTPGKKYSFLIATVLKNGSTSKRAVSFVST
ncbi:interferon-induced very large GTPase 1-like, partial [Clarias magur]